MQQLKHVSLEPDATDLGDEMAYGTQVGLAIAGPVGFFGIMTAASVAWALWISK
jgi:hypothetical protein